MRAHRFTILIALASILPSIPPSILPAVVASQEKFPDKQVTILHQFPPGGGVDLTTRGMSTIIEKYLGQQTIVVNKPGGGGLMAGITLINSKPDGYTTAALNPLGTDPELYSHFLKPAYSFKDLLPVARIMFDPYGIVVKADSPWKTLKDLTDYAKTNPGTVSWGHQGLGHPYYLRGISLTQQLGLKMNDVPFKGSRDECLAVLGGKVDAAIVSIAGSRGFLEANQLRMLAVQHPTRLSYMPNIPTFAEQGNDVGFPLHFTSLFAPKGTPPERVKILHDAVKSTLEDERFKEMMRKGGSDVLYGSAKDIIDDVERTRAVFSKVFKSLGIQ